MNRSSPFSYITNYSKYILQIYINHNKGKRKMEVNISRLSSNNFSLKLRKRTAIHKFLSEIGITKDDLRFKVVHDYRVFTSTSIPEVFAVFEYFENRTTITFKDTNDHIVYGNITIFHDNTITVKFEKSVPIPDEDNELYDIVHTLLTSVALFDVISIADNIS